MNDPAKELAPLLQRYAYRPGDRIVVTIPYRIPADRAHRIYDLLANWLPEGAPRPLLLEHGATLSILGPEGTLHWHPVSEKLPDEFVEVLALAQTPGSDGRIAQAYLDGERWKDNHTDATLEGITHWAHLDYPPPTP